MRSLIISLTRFGDLLQTQPVISGLKAQGGEVGLVCLENFASTTTLLADLDYVLPLPGARFLALLDSDWRKSVLELSRVRDSLARDFDPDVVVNLTPSVSARLLSRVFKGSEVRGFGMDELGFNADSSSWAVFLQTASADRGTSPFNVVDLFCRSAGLPEGKTAFRLNTPDDKLLKKADRLLAGCTGEVPNAKGYVAFQLGASEDRRRWPVKSFVRLARRFWKEEGRVAVLVGSKGERELGQRFEALVDFPVANVMGETSLPELAAVLCRMDVLATNDTGTMHLAAGLGLPVAAIFLATAQPWDTGPYRPGMLCFEPDIACHPCSFGRECRHGEKCRETIEPDAVYEFARRLLPGAGEPGEVDVSQPLRVWKTSMGDDGLFTLESLSGHGRSDRALWIVAQRWFYRRFLDGENLSGWPGGKPEFEAEYSASLKSVLSEADSLIFLLIQQGTVLSKDPLPMLKDKFLENCRRLHDLLAGDPRTGVLGSLWLFETQRTGGDLSVLMALVERYGRLVRGLLDILT